MQIEKSIPTTELISIEKGVLVEMIWQYGKSSDASYTKLMKVIDNNLGHFYCWEATGEELYFYIEHLSEKDIIKLIEKTFV